MRTYKRYTPKQAMETVVGKKNFMARTLARGELGALEKRKQIKAVNSTTIGAEDTSYRDLLSVETLARLEMLEKRDANG